MGETFQRWHLEILSTGVDIECYLECLPCLDGGAGSDIHHRVLRVDVAEGNIE